MINMSCRSCGDILYQLKHMNLEIRRLHVTVTNQIHSIKCIISEPNVTGGERF